MIYDLIVIGGGPAGYLAGERAGHAGLKTLVIEKQFIGGVCLNEGCIPTKTLLYSAKLKDGAEHGAKRRRRRRCARRTLIRTRKLVSSIPVFSRPERKHPAGCTDLASPANSIY